ncbi:MAG TPA: AI-2E family transporter, partial [Gemmatimonadaceae bacterium]|nr:AI-2E family transporter [Gemmatimonadaceae bacterium]
MDSGSRLHLPTREILRILGIIFGFYIALRLVWIAHPVIFLFFLGVLFGLPLAQGGNWFKKRGIPRGIGVAAILIAFLGLLIGGAAGMAPMLRTQSKELRQRLPEAMDKIDNWLGRHDGMLGMFMTNDTPVDSARNSVVIVDSAGSSLQGVPAITDSTGGAKDTLRAGSNLRREITHQFQGAQHSFLRVLTSTFAITGAFMLVLFIAAYIGADPALYHGGILEMFPVAERPRVALTLRRVSVVLRRWLVTQLIAMLVIGGVTTLFLVVL